MIGSASGGRVLVVGSSNTDLVCVTDRLPSPGETVPSRSFAVYPGGKAANQAVAAARAGASVSFVGAFGDDAYGAARRGDLEAEGVDVTHCRVFNDTPSGLALIAVDRSGENQIITVGGANDLIEPDQLAAAFDDIQPQVVLLPNENPFAVVEAALELEGRTTTVFNAAPFVGRLTEIVGGAGVLICNEIEAAGFLRYPIDQGNASRAVSELAVGGGRRAIITLGAAGAIGFDGTQIVRAPAVEVEVVDTTGAGDAFCGAFSAWYARGATFKDALRAGTVAGALAVETPGAQPSLPDRDSIETRL